MENLTGSTWAAVFHVNPYIDPLTATEVRVSLMV